MMEIRNVTIVGAGTMGHSLALAFARQGTVSGSLISGMSLVQARKMIASNLQTMVETGWLDKDQQAPMLDRIQTTTRIEDAGRHAALVIEAISEDETAKKELFVRWIRYAHGKPF